MADFSPDTCPVGITNAKNVEKLGDHFDMAIGMLTEKVTEMKDDITALSKKMDENFENVDKRFTNMEASFQSQIADLKNSIPTTVETKIEEKRGKAAVGAWKYVLMGIFIPIGVAIIIALIKYLLGI